MKIILGAACAAAAVALATAGSAEMYKDWTPQRGVWQVTAIHVDPNHMDDYLTGLKTTWVTGNEIAKKHGVIDAYDVSVKLDAAADGPNVLLRLHYPSLAALEPDRTRDEALERETLAVVSKQKGQAMVAGFEKYRTFVGEGLYQSVDLGK